MLNTQGSEQTGTSVLLRDGQRLAKVRGSRIDAQFTWGDAGFLLFVSFGHIFSAVETIYFLDRAGRRRDEATLGDPMAEGLISDIAVDGPDRVSFRFPMDEARAVEVGRRTAWLGLRTRWLRVL